MTSTGRPARIAIVGAGWRAALFAGIMKALPEEFDLVGVAARRRESAERAAASWGTAAFDDPVALATGARPELTVVCVPWPDNPQVVSTLAAEGFRVLSETPPAPDLAGLHQLWDRIGGLGLVQVAEQYCELPGHAARRAVVRGGAIGEVSGVEVSSTHGYHAVSLMRGFLGHVGAAPVTVQANRFTGVLADPLSRAGWSDDLSPKPAETTVATVDFGTGYGLYDFTDNQWHNQLRFRRILVRGSRGEIQDDRVVRVVGV